MSNNVRYHIYYYDSYTSISPFSDIVFSKRDLENRLFELGFLGYTRISYWRF